MQKVKDMEITGKKLGLKSITGKLLAIKQVAALLNVSERYVQKGMHDGTFPIPWYFINDRGRFVDSADLDTFLNNVRISAGQKPLPLKAEKEVLSKT